MYNAGLYNAGLYNGSGATPPGPIHNVQVQAMTLLQGAVLAMPLTFPSPAPLRVEVATATLLTVRVVAEPGSS